MKMDPRKCVTTHKSLDAVLFLIPQVARNLRELFRCALSNEGFTEESNAHFAHQEAVLGELYEALDVTSKDRWGIADDRLQKAILNCEELRERLYREDFQREVKNLNSKLNGEGDLGGPRPGPAEDAKTKANRLARLLDDGPISNAPGGLEATSSVGEGQNGEER